MVTLIILDGFGCRKELTGNAIKLATTPFLNKLKESFPHTLLNASGEAVGLSKNQMGNSEVGHLTIGSGRILLQDLEKINTEIKNGNFFKNKEFNKAIEFVKKNSGALHLIGLVSDGGVHSHINHLKALIELAHLRGVDKTYIHIITDGRDTSIDSGLSFVQEIHSFCKGKNAEIISICGRSYAMDREKRYENTKRAYDMLVFGRIKPQILSSKTLSKFDDCYSSNNCLNSKTLSNDNLSINDFLKSDTLNCDTKNCGILSTDTSKSVMSSKSTQKNDLKSETKSTLVEIIRRFYCHGIYDEFIEPTLVGKPRTINENDAVCFFNFRSDRMRQLADALTNPNFSIFKTKKLSNVFFTSMTEYSQDLENISVAYPNENVKNTLSEVLSKFNKKQFHIAETTKYAHVTFFFNGGREKPFLNEDRCLIPTHDDPDFTKNPKMRALEITEKVKEIIAKKKYDFILINFSNPDMLGHTANLEATKKAITCVDKCAYEIATACLEVKGTCIITADHGNAEMLIDHKGNPCTTHTTNPVPFLLIAPKLEKKSQDKKDNNSNKTLKADDFINQETASKKDINFSLNANEFQLDGKIYKLKNNGGLSNIAPTILELLDLPRPPEMSDSLILH